MWDLARRPSRVRAPFAALWLAACGAQSSSGTDERAEAPLLPPNEAALHGEWRSDYVTAGLVARYTRLRFAPGDHLRLDTVGFGGEMPTGYDGGYALTPEGTVRYFWGDEGRIEREDDLTFVDGRALELAHPCCSRVYSRWWTHRGYRATSPDRTRFGRATARRVFDADGGLESSLATRVELTFSAPPSQLARGGPCTLDVSIHLEWSESDSADTRDFELGLDCAAREHLGLSIVLFPGWDWIEREGRSLEHAPFNARSLWERMLADHSELDEWPNPLRTLLGDAFELYLAFDEERPDVLFHYLEPNTLDATGYSYRGTLDSVTPQWPFTD